MLHLADRGPQLVDVAREAQLAGVGCLGAPAHLVGEAVDGAHHGALAVLRVHEGRNLLRVLDQARLESLQRAGVLGERGDDRGQGLLSLGFRRRRAVEVIDEHPVEVLLPFHEGADEVHTQARRRRFHPVPSKRSTSGARARPR